MLSDLLSLPPRDGSGALNVVVESPRGSGVKLKYSVELRAFVLSRPLVVGVVYPFDWGFVPGTRAADGDPVDVAVLIDAPTYPGVVIPCRPLAVLEVEQNAKEGGRQRNDRIIAEPVKSPRSTGIVPERVRREIEAFFVAATQFEGKDLRMLGWGDAAAAEALVDRSSQRV